MYLLLILGLKEVQVSLGKLKISPTSNICDVSGDGNFWVSIRDFQAGNDYIGYS
jgi:hypothetical protein